VAVFDKAYDALGPLPKPPELRVGQPVQRTLIVYNDTFADEAVTVRWEAKLAGNRIAGADVPLQIPLGDHVEIQIAFTPPKPGNLELILVSQKNGKECFRDTKPFVASGQ
jgi:hypothetical protein